MTLRVLDLFSGIGGFSLGLERTGGFKTVAFCEIEPFCRRVLAKHWPGVPCYDDVRSLTSERLTADGIEVDVICGGFPCQDISFAGAGAGLAGERSGLWYEYARLIGELGPRYVIVENVAALLVRGMGDVLGTLASLGYDAEWHCIPASAIGLGQRRDRVWIIAFPSYGDQRPLLDKDTLHAFRIRTGIHGADVEEANAYNQNRRTRAMSILGDFNRAEIPNRERIGTSGRLSDGVDRYRGIGNAVVPQIPELIGHAILDTAT